MGTKSLTESLRETLALFDRVGVPMTTTEIASELDLGRRSTYERLARLEEQGEIETKKVGANARVWWRPPSMYSAETDWQGAAESLVDDVLSSVEIGIFVLDENFDVAWINDATERYFGLDRTEVLGRDKRTLVDEQIAPAIEDSESFTERVFATYDDNTSIEQFECRTVSGGDGTARWLEHWSRPIETGEFAGGRVELYYDVTDRKESEQSSREFESLVDTVEEYAIFTLDTDGYVQTWNPGAREITGYDADEILGEHFSTFYTEADRLAGVPEENLEIAATQGTYTEEGWRVRRDGSKFWSNVTITAIRDDDGTLEGYAKVTRDMTDRREYEQKLREERDLVEQMFETVPVGISVLSGDDEVLRTNSRASEMFGGDGEVFDGLESTPLSDESGTPVPPSHLPTNRALATGEPVSDWVCQLDVAGDGKRWLSLTAAPLESGEHDDRIVLCTEDITQFKEQSRQLRRQRNDLESELSEVFERVDDAFYAVDQEFRFTYVNERASELLDQAEEDLLGRNVFEVFPEATQTSAPEAFRTALDEQGQTSFETYFEPIERWVEVRVYPSASGLSVYFRDVSERKQRRRELERYQETVETIWDGIALVDEDDRFRMVNDAFCALAGYERDELLGAEASIVLAEEDAPFAWDVGDGSQEFATAEFTVETSAGERVPVEARFGPYSDERVGQGRIGVIRDVRERKERERALEESERRYRTLVECFPDGLVALFDEEYRFRAAGGELLEEMVIPVEGSGDDLTPTDLPEEVERYLAAAIDGESNSFDIEYHERDLHCDVVPIGEDDVTSGLLLVRDVTERRERERQLQKQVAEQEVITSLGKLALEEGDVDELFAEATNVITETLGTDYCKVLELDPAAEELLLVEGVGWDDGTVGSTTVSSVAPNSQAAHTLETEAPVVVENLQEDSRFSGPELLTEHDVTAGISVIIGSQDQPWGILGTHQTDEMEYTEQDVNFVQSVANILASAISQQRFETKLVRQREELAALNSLHEVVREINSAVVEQSTREEIEQTVCDHIANAESYSFAWIGGVDRAEDVVTPRASAKTNGYLDEVRISVDPDDETAEGPTGMAIRTGEVQVCQDILTDPAYEPWRDHARAFGFKSSAAIPIVHEDTIYGVLNLYSERAHGFRRRELTVLRQLGQSIGHTIAALERKRALLSDELVELEFQSRDFPPGRDDVSIDGRISLEETVPIKDGEYLVYGTADEEGIDALDELAAVIPHWTEVSVREDSDGRFQVRMTDPPVLSTVASLGGSIEEAVIEHGEYRLVVHVSPSADVGVIIDSVHEADPNAEMVARRQLETAHDRPDKVRQLLDTELTERQRASLRSAYYGGYFEWPRDVHAQDIAESLDIAPATFSQHLRKAENKVFGAILGDEDASATA